MTTQRSGSCLCGAVRFVAETKGALTACHCGMCLRWAGGPFLSVPCESVTFEADETLAVRTTSPWAERGHCRECGSSVFYRVTAEGEHQGATNVALGTLEDASGLAFEREWYIDLKPNSYAFAGEREVLTSEQIAAMFGV